MRSWVVLRREGADRDPGGSVQVPAGALTIDDLVAGENVLVAATGVTDGELLRGVRFEHREVVTQSLSMRSKSGAVRLIETRHRLGKSNLIARAR